jgi:hypothetical protein
MNDAVPAEHQASEMKARPSGVQVISSLEKATAGTCKSSL